MADRFGIGIYGIQVWDFCFSDIGLGLGSGDVGVELVFGISVLGLGHRDMGFGLGSIFLGSQLIYGVSTRNIWTIRSIYGLSTKIYGQYDP